MCDAALRRKFLTNYLYTVINPSLNYEVWFRFWRHVELSIYLYA